MVPNLYFVFWRTGREKMRGGGGGGGGKNIPQRSFKAYNYLRFLFICTPTGCKLVSFRILKHHRCIS